MITQFINQDKIYLLITQFINQDKFKNISFDKKCEIIHVSRKTLFNYRSKDMTEQSQKKRMKAKGRRPKLSEEEINEFFKQCKEKRVLKLAVTTKWAIQMIKQITKNAWEPCYSTVSKIFNKHGWRRRKSQKRSPFSDPQNKHEKIDK